MKELLILIAIIAVGFLLMADTHITLKPFSIKFESPYNAIGFLLIFIGVVFIKIDAERKGVRKAIDRIAEAVSNLDKDTDK